MALGIAASVSRGKAHTARTARIDGRPEAAAMRPLDARVGNGK